jgi:N-acetyl-gamma-glutamyl-phosphate reductase
MQRVKVGIIGGSSYVAGELIGLLSAHPQVELGYVESAQAAGKQLWEVHGFLYDVLKLCFRPYSLDEAKDCQLIFIAKPHTQAMDYAADLLAWGARVIDLSADFRLRDENTYSSWYGMKHKYPQLLETAVYGLPELYGTQLREASLVANPGCYPTSVVLGLAPLLVEHLAAPRQIKICAYSGLSGAGRTPQAGKNLFIDVYSNLKPYKVNQHPHIPEIEQELSRLYKDEVRVSFVPHLAPLDRGILSTIYLGLQRQVDLDELLTLYRRFYRQHPFIRIYDAGCYPEVLNVKGTNFCDIGLGLDQKNQTLIVFSGLDNTLKGASGQAVQNMNLMFGFKESTGLPFSRCLGG